MVRAWPGEAHLAGVRSLLDEVKNNEVKTFLIGTGKAASTVRSIAALFSSLSLAAVEHVTVRNPPSARIGG